MKLFKRLKKNDGGIPEPSLNITAMADIFTVLLVFLIQSFTSGAMDVIPTSNVALPPAAADTKNMNALKVELSKDGYYVEGKKTERKDLAKALRRQTKASDTVIIIADSKVPYQSVKEVLALAAQAGWKDYKFLVWNTGT